MMKRKIFTVAALFISSLVFSQTQPDSAAAVMGESSFTSLDQVVVTAFKTPQKESVTGKVMTVITKAQLEQNAGKTITEILNTVPGVSINGANNVLGTNQTVNIRGASAGNALILIDGIPVNDPSVITNYFDLNLISTEQVERIEILKGGQSTLYGSDAVAGVINIITKKSSGKKISADISSAAGSYSTFRNYAGVSGTLKNISWSARYSNIQSTGFSSAYDSTGSNHFDKDGFNQNEISTGVLWKPNSNLTVKWHGRYGKYKTGVDATAFTDDKDFFSTSKTTQTGAGLVYKLHNGSLNFNYLLNSTLRTYTDDSTDRGNFFAYYSDARYKGLTHFAELYSSFQWEHIELLTGIDYRNNHTSQDYYSFGPYGPYSSSLNGSLAHMWQLSPYASAIYKTNNGLSAEAGLRWNHHSEYGDNFTYTLNPSYLINHKLKLFANIYSSFKTPTLYQLFDAYAGNPDLKAEKSSLFETGAELFAGSGFRTRLVYFNRNTKDAIQFVTINPSTYESRYININRQKNEGAEWEGEYKTGSWSLTANYTYTSGKTISSYDETGSKLNSDTSYNNLYRIPKHVFNFSAGMNVTKKLFVRADLKTVGKRLEPVYGAAPETLSSYYTIGVYGGYRFSKKWSLFLDLKNITNQQYFDILGYNSRKFNFMTGFTLNLP